jgi:hypothetical protein
MYLEVLLAHSLLYLYLALQVLQLKVVTFISATLTFAQAVLAQTVELVFRMVLLSCK